MKLTRADLVSLLGILIIMGAFFALLEGYSNIALALLFFSVVCDFVDGPLARIFGASPYGKYLDSFYDVLAYLAFIATYLVAKTEGNIFILFAAFFMVLTGVLRLARFTEEGLTHANGMAYYTGMPVYYLLFFPLLSYIGISSPFIAGGVMIASYCMLSRIPFRKVTHPIYPILMFITGILFLIWP